MRLSYWTPFVLSLLASALASPLVLADDDAPPLSAAQIALFESDHLKDINQAARLEYSFRHDAVAASGAADASYSDRIDIDVRPRSDGAKDVWTDFLSAEHHVAFPPLMDFHGNPVVMYFLEHDVAEMHRLTGGAATYFRNRIRQAFVDRAAVKSIEVEHEGKMLTATEITLTPFREDQRIAVFPGLADKRYRFVLVPAVPGTIFEIDAEAVSQTGQFSAKETVVFTGTGPCTGDSGPCAPPASQP